MYCVFAMHNYNDYMRVHHSKSNYQAARSRRSQEVELVICTDGSTKNIIERGGAGIFIEDKKIAIEERLSFVAGKICSSFGAEGMAMLRAL